jgi:hypothetical protein
LIDPFLLLMTSKRRRASRGIGGFVRRRTTATLRLAHIPGIEKHTMKCVALQAQV